MDAATATQPSRDEIDAALFHDMQQPIAAMRLVFGALEDRGQWAPEDRRLVELAAAQAEALQAMLDARLDRRNGAMAPVLRSSGARSGPPTPASAGAQPWTDDPDRVSLDEVVRSVIEPLLVSRPGRIRYFGTAGAPIRSAPLALRRAVANVIMNAAEATEPDGIVQIVLRSASGSAVLTVDDSGAGFGHKPVGRGIGLASSTSGVLHAGGRIAYLHSPLGGVRVRLVLPTDAS